MRISDYDAVTTARTGLLLLLADTVSGTNYKITIDNFSGQIAASYTPLSATGAFAPAAGTGVFITTGQTGNFVTTPHTGFQIVSGNIQIWDGGTSAWAILTCTNGVISGIAIP